MVSRGTAASISNHYSNPVTDSGYTPPAPKPQPHRSWWSKSWSWTKQTFGTWDGWKNRVLPAVGFGACLVVSAGLCVGAGVAIATVDLVGDRAETGKWAMKSYGKSLAWTAAGGLVGGSIARLGAKSWGEAFTGDVFGTAEVEVPLYRTKMGLGTGVGGGRKGWVTAPGEVPHRGSTLLNLAVNAQVGWGICGEGADSALHGHLGC